MMRGNGRNEMNYRIAIPSYQRSDQLVDKTLKLLERHNINPDIVDVFVANQEEYDKYKSALSKTPYQNLIIGERGMGAIRRFTQKYYPEGTRVMNFDDDLIDILRKENDKKMVPVENLEEQVILRGFKELEKEGAYLFGVYAAANAMFMKHRVAVGLYYVIGSCWGLITRHDNDLSVTLDDKEDFERTLQHYVKDGKVVRLDDITCKTKYYGIGGMQEERTEDRITKSAEDLVKRFPGLCTMYIRETTNHAELRLKDTRSIKTTADSKTLDSFFS